MVREPIAREARRVESGMNGDGHAHAASGMGEGTHGTAWSSVHYSSRRNFLVMK